MFDISIELSTTNPFRNERVFLCSLLKYTRGLSVYYLSVKQLIFLTFYLKTNKVKNQIYTKLTVKTAETDSNIDSKNPKKSLQKFYKPQPPYLNNITFLLGQVFVR